MTGEVFTDGPDVLQLQWCETSPHTHQIMTFWIKWICVYNPLKDSFCRYETERLKFIAEARMTFISVILHKWVTFASFLVFIAVIIVICQYCETD